MVDTVEIIIKHADLKPTRQGFMRIFWEIRNHYPTLPGAYEATEAYFSKQGYTPCFSTYYAFRKYYYKLNQS